LSDVFFAFSYDDSETIEKKNKKGILVILWAFKTLSRQKRLKKSGYRW